MKRLLVLIALLALASGCATCTDPGGYNPGRVKMRKFVNSFPECEEYFNLQVYEMWQHGETERAVVVTCHWGEYRSQTGDEFYLALPRDYVVTLSTNQDFICMKGTQATFRSGKDNPRPFHFEIDRITRVGTDLLDPSGRGPQPYHIHSTENP